MIFIKISLISTEDDIAAQGIRIISSCLKKNGHSTRLIFLPNFNRLYSPKIIEEIINLVKDTDVIGLSCIALVSERTEQLIQALKILKKPMIWGGIHATLNPFECLKFADFVCVGEGEEATLKLVNLLEKKNDSTNISNFYTKKEKTIIKNEISHLIPHLDKLPFADYDFNEKYILHQEKLVPFSEYFFKRGEFNQAKPALNPYSRFVVINTIRGCPNACSFCCNSDLKRLYKNKGTFVRFRNIKNVIQELSQLKKKIPSLKYIWFRDESFFLRSEKEFKIFSELYRKEINLPFMCYGDPITVTPKKLRLLLDAGLNYINVGLQTGAEQFNRNINNRPIRNVQILKTAKLLNQYKNQLRVEYQIIMMNPYEKEEDLIKTINLLIQLPKPYRLGRFNLVFFPGSLLYFKAKKDGFLKEKKDSCFNFNFSEFSGHIKTKKLKTVYLNCIIQAMGRNVTKRRYGIIPTFMLPFLLHKKIIKFSNDSRFICNVFPIFISLFKQLFDDTKMNLLRLYRRLNY